MPVINNRKEIDLGHNRKKTLSVPKIRVLIDGKVVAMVNEISIRQSLDMKKIPRMEGKGQEFDYVYDKPCTEAELSKIYGTDEFMFSNKKFDIVVEDEWSKTTLKDCFASQTAFATFASPSTETMFSEYMKVQVGSVGHKFLEPRQGIEWEQMNNFITEDKNNG